MELKPGYKLTEVGVIPEDWEVVTATQMCDLVVDCKNRTPPLVIDSDYAVVRTSNVRNGQFVLEDLRFTDEVSYHKWTTRAIPQFGDIMITREAPLGEVCAVPHERKVCLGQRMMLYRVSRNTTDYLYLLYSLMSFSVRANLLRKVGGSTVGHAKVNDIRFLQLPYPPLPEQRSIATALSDMDELLGGLDRLITKKLDLKQSAMQQLLTGKTRLAGFSEGENYKQTEVGVIPDTWEIQTLGRISTISRLAGAEYTSFWTETVNGEIIALRGFNIGKGKIVERDLVRISNKLSLKLKRSRLCKGDVVYPCVGSIGNAVAVTEDCKYHIQQNIARITPKPCVINSCYLVNFLMSTLAITEVERFTSSSSQPSILVGSLRQYRIPLPPTLKEQNAIASILSDMDTEITTLEQRRNKTRDIKQAMMQELLTGRIRLL